jgi:hypothetical protein
LLQSLLWGLAFFLLEFFAESYTIFHVLFIL